MPRVAEPPDPTGTGQAQSVTGLTGGATLSATPSAANLAAALGGGATLHVTATIAADITADLTASANMTVHLQALNLLLLAVVEPIGRVPDGELIEWIQPAYDALVAALRANPDFRFSLDWRKFEELVAAAYRRLGHETILTPRSRDFGRDVIANVTLPGVARIRIVDSVKRFGPTQLVDANDVRALVGVMHAEGRLTGQDVRGVVTTTARFAPRVREDRLLRQFLDNGSLELVDGDALIARLSRSL
jgi:hypothetical protein